MALPNEKFISNYIQSQFPDFYNEEGPLFIEFVKTYYEYLEQEGNETGDTRKFLDMQDVDKTTDEFISHFQNKYLTGIPTETLLNKPMLIKHILDIYRAKGTERGYKLLFRLLFNEELDYYVPAEDILTPSDGTWYIPRYIELNNMNNLDLQKYIGKKIIGVSSKVTGIVESVITEPVNSNILTTVYLSNLTPKGSVFTKGEKICLPEELGTEIFSLSPTIIGSLNYIQVTSGGQNFRVGNVLRPLYYDSNNNVTTTGYGGELKVKSISRGDGAAFFTIEKAGWGYKTDATKILYKPDSDTTGNGADFNLGSFTNISFVNWNDDLLIDDDFSLALSTNGYMNTVISSSDNYTNSAFGAISTLTDIATGNSYTQDLNINVRQLITAKNPLSGVVSYNSNSYIVTGTNTAFNTLFQANSIIVLQGNSSNLSTKEYHIVNSVTNAISLTLKNKPITNSTASATHKTAVGLFRANFNDEFALASDGKYYGENAFISGVPSFGNGIVSELVAVDSGKGYLDGEFLNMYLYAPVETPVIVSGGTLYANGDALIFSGGGTAQQATGSVITNSNGTIVDTTISNYGSSYQYSPTIKVKSKHGTGAILTSSIGDFNTSSVVRGRTVLGGSGTGKGRWTTTRSFLNSDKYIQDSYYYQDFSYELKSSIAFNKYKQMLINIYHPAGFELFGKFQNTTLETNHMALLYDDTGTIG